MDEGTLYCCLPVIIFFGIIIWMTCSDVLKKRKAKLAAPKTKTQYEEALERIKLNPTNPNLHQEALRLGREYAKLDKEATGVSNRTEIMLQNEISAASAGAISRMPFSAATEIKKLTELLQEGILTQDEWQSAKNNLVGVKSSQVDDAVKMLRSLHQLVSLGGLTEGEYNMKKWEILSQKLIKRP